MASESSEPTEPGDIAILPACGLELAEPVVADCCVKAIAPWGCIEDVRCKLDDDENELFTDEDILKALAWATEQITRMLPDDYGYKRFVGMPCAEPCICRCDPCSCCAYETLEIKHHSICQLSRVVINCVDQDLSNYRIDRDCNGIPVIVKLDGRWPNEQCYQIGICDDPQVYEDGYCLPDSLWVEYIYGCPIPYSGHLAAACMARNFLYLCDDGLAKKCEFPRNAAVVSRQGVTFQDNNNNTGFGIGMHRTGVREVDSFLDAMNPNHLSASGCLMNPRTQKTKDMYHHAICCEVPESDREWITIHECV